MLSSYVIFWQRYKLLQICYLLTTLRIATNMLSSDNTINCYKYVIFWQCNKLLQICCYKYVIFWQRYEFLQICYLLATLWISTNMLSTDNAMKFATNMLSSELCSLYVYINVITATHDCPNKNRNKYIHYITMVVFSST